MQDKEEKEKNEQENLLEHNASLITIKRDKEGGSFKSHTSALFVLRKLWPD